ncbi:hypothetical protein L198_02290 [Cryptococcus wingfieldii CBS 7118]|uniref:[acyl-carrier-protein] S-malonyltransferase n=1 Tax=Cryptococcus wingfieldii CBS 7118 TaxID=1295528 RepID=A0A1E3JRI7_9TREE|nr:hypothetical protein L198_02290 [Cryptococcus wingfieldii CBS 7118]ODO03443.1 hypothetical protein L198_02290 [Cryptococcus wingfieldii CBS 7118]
MRILAPSRRRLPRHILPASCALSYTPAARTQATTDRNEWLDFLKTETPHTPESSGKALLFAGLGSYPHTPHAPTPSSLHLWEEASEALLSPDATIGYQPIRSADQVKGGLRSWVEGRSLDDLMKRPDITTSFILASSLAILKSEQERNGYDTLLPPEITHLAGHGFIGMLTALVAAGKLDLATGVRLARIYATLPPSPPGRNRPHLTTVLSARHFHSLSSPSFSVPPPTHYATSDDDPLPPLAAKDPASGEVEVGERQGRRRAMQLILDEIHGLEPQWAEHSQEGHEEWAEAGIINSSKVVVVSGTHDAVLQVIERLQQLNLANPVMDIHMPCPYHTKLMSHAVPNFRDVLDRCYFTKKPDGPVILDTVTTKPIGNSASALLPHLTDQLRWHKTLVRLYSTPTPEVGTFYTVGRGAKGLGIMLRGELKRRLNGSAPIHIEEMGVGPRDERLVRALRG